MKREIFIEGMTCNHCKMRVEKTLSQMEGVTSAEVILAEGKAIVETDASIEDQLFIEAIDDAGYDVQEIR